MCFLTQEIHRKRSPCQSFYCNGPIKLSYNSIAWSKNGAYCGSVIIWYTWIRQKNSTTPKMVDITPSISPTTALPRRGCPSSLERTNSTFADIPSGKAQKQGEKCEDAAHHWHRSIAARTIAPGFICIWMFLRRRCFIVITHRISNPFITVKKENSYILFWKLETAAE